MFILPALIIYIYFEKPSLSFYFISFLMTILIPIIPTVFSSAIGYIVKLLASKSNSSKIVQTILSSIIFLGIFFLSTNLESFIENIATQATSINDLLTKIYYPLGLYIYLITIYMNSYTHTHTTEAKKSTLFDTYNYTLFQFSKEIPRHS